MKYQSILTLLLITIISGGMIACSSKTDLKETKKEAIAISETAGEVEVDSAQTLILGHWVYDLPKGSKHSFEGIYIREKGRASSINQNELVYELWDLGEGAITISGFLAKEEKRFKETYQIVTLTMDSLVIDNRKGEKISFYRLGK